MASYETGASSSEETLTSAENARELKNELKTLEAQLKKKSFDELPEETQLRIKEIQRQLQKMDVHREKFEGNVNHFANTLVMSRLSEVLTDKEKAKKFIQTSDRNGKYLLKPIKQKHEYVLDGKNNKQKKKKQVETFIKEETTHNEEEDY